MFKCYLVIDGEKKYFIFRLIYVEIVVVRCEDYMVLMYEGF